MIIAMTDFSSGAATQHQGTSGLCVVNRSGRNPSNARRKAFPAYSWPRVSDVKLVMESQKIRVRGSILAERSLVARTASNNSQITTTTRKANGSICFHVSSRRSTQHEFLATNAQPTASSRPWFPGHSQMADSRRSTNALQSTTS
jgi:hypothetical protein